ncbi:MAG: hypothetical protein ACRC9O_02060 [Plesiomonas sp.]|uniref:hypothetical protein n=1 Tax=Plesiomonas sp. TaxID=2486279 RepID=UPI003F2BC149
MNKFMYSGKEDKKAERYTDDTSLLFSVIFDTAIFRYEKSTVLISETKKSKINSESELANLNGYFAAA